MTFDEFVNAAIEYARDHPEQRFGQAVMNALSWCRSDLSGKTLDIWECKLPTDPLIFHYFYELEQLW